MENLGNVRDILLETLAKRKVINTPVSIFVEAADKTQYKNLIIEIERFYVATRSWKEQKPEAVNVPEYASCFQMFKAEYFPKWLVKILPVRFKDREIQVKVEHNHYKVCPHLPISSREDKVEHLKWLARVDAPDTIIEKLRTILDYFTLHKSKIGYEKYIQKYKFLSASGRQAACIINDDLEAAINSAYKLIKEKWEG